MLPVVGFVGASGSGKTTLLTAVLPELRRAGLRVAVLKHAHHGFEMDRPGKDTYRAREAGATQVLIASRHRWALLTELEGDFAEPPFGELLGRFDRDRIDLVLAEGFAGECYPKIEVHRPALGEPPRCWPGDRDVIAVATDAPLAVARPVRRLDLNAPVEVATFVLAHLAATDALRPLMIRRRRLSRSFSPTTPAAAADTARTAPSAGSSAAARPPG